MGDSLELEDLLIVIRRRILFFIIPTVIALPIGVIAVFLLPPQYTAQGTILVESQQIPEEFVTSTINTYAEERIQVIRQRVMTRERLLSVADKHDLFANRPGLSGTEKVKLMREHLDVRLISADAGNRRRRDDATIAFEVSYVDRAAKKAYSVANEFITLFLTEDVRARKDGASDTTEFFDQEAKRMRAAVDEIERRIADYRRDHADALPEHLDLHMSELDRATDSLKDAEDQLQILDEERRALETQLSSYIAGAGAPRDGPAQELTQLRSRLAALRAEKTEQHPDVVALRLQISALERQFAPSTAIRELQDQLQSAEEAFEAARQSKDETADIDALRAEVSRLRKTFSAKLIEEASDGANDFLAAQIQTRLETVNARLTSTMEEIDDLGVELEKLEDRIARTPAVARGLAVLERDQRNLETQYQVVQAKRQSAITAENLEDGQKAEKFSILEPAAIPESPSDPDRLKLSVLAMVAAFSIGGACAAAAELLSGALRGRSHLNALIDEAPIAVIPYIDAEGERRLFSSLASAFRRTPERAPA
ncbi:MAG: Wzz/FepE/Etk N-terminal domain-containing protein [Pseudomonadota bacterium]